MTLETGLLKEFILSRPQLKEAQEIVFFGGSFNPWHPGHTSCVSLLPVEKKLVVLPDHNPYKELTPTVQKNENLEQIKTELAPLSRPLFIFEGFLKANKKNPTFYWLRDLKQTLPKKNLSLLMGFDSFTGLDKWIEAPKLLNLLRAIYVASRQDNPAVKKEQVKTLKELAPRLEIVFLGGHPHEGISSSKIRNDVSN